MKSIKVKPGETFELIVIDDQCNEMAKQCYLFDESTQITVERKNGFLSTMDLVPTFDYAKVITGPSENID